MASGFEKKWNRPWSMEEMIENAEKWSLAGDVAVLNTLKAYSENLFSRTVSLSDNVDNLLHNLDEVGLKLDISQNQFQSLRNTQFIESRVYEDDETLENFKEDIKPEEVPSEEEKEKLLRESVLEGLRVMDEYFEKVEVSISDSEDEESEVSYILRPKDLYADRPLPLVIGTEEWYKKLNVALADSSSESESEKVSETYSDSESGDDLPKGLMKGSETSSELDFSSQASENRPAANSTFKESARKSNNFESDDDSEEQGSFPVKTPISSKSFAEQLAAKLGDVISEREDVSTEEINRKPIQPAQSSKFAGNLFPDEPPPLDDLEDTILQRSAQEGLFSGGKGLFSDNEDEPFWGQPNKLPSVKTSDGIADSKQSGVTADEKVATPATLLPESSRVSKGLFDSDSDDDIFAAKQKQAAKQPFLQPYTTAAPLFDEEPPELDVPKKLTEETPKKKPVGGVSIFGKTNLFSGENVENILKSRQTSSDNKTETKTRDDESRQTVRSAKSSEENVTSKRPSLFDKEKKDDKVVTISNKPKKITLFDDDEDNNLQPAVKPKTTSLFDDEDDIFKEDLFSGIATKKLTTNLFDDIEKGVEDLFSTNIDKNDQSPKVDLFSDLTGGKNRSIDKIKTEQRSTETLKKKLDLFSDFEEDRLFSKTPIIPKNSDEPSKVEAASYSEITENAVISDRKTNMSDEVDRGVAKTVGELPKRQVIGAEKISSEKKTVKHLFDGSSEGSDTEDIFMEAGGKKTQDKPDLFGENRGLETDASTTENVSTAPHQDQPTTTNPRPEESDVTKNPPKPKIAVNLFGSSPPPDDDDWDTKSDHFSDEEHFSYPTNYNTAGSSLFDNEPPSLGPNESSGIVRDQNVTRLDADESSFNPYASSSRRLSSDVFSDQQLQDSFFVTKNKTESVSIPQPLDEIPEAGTSSNLDITPSGNLEDFEYSKGSSSATDVSSVFQENSQDHPTSSSKKTISLFDDVFDDSTDTEDLFSSLSKSRNLPKLSDKRLSLFDNIGDVLEENVIKGSTSGSKNSDSTEDSAGIDKTSIKIETPGSAKADSPPEVPTKTNRLSKGGGNTTLENKSGKDIDGTKTGGLSEDAKNVIEENPSEMEKAEDSMKISKSTNEETNIKRENANRKEDADTKKNKLHEKTQEQNVAGPSIKGKEATKSPRGSPGKLKHNLNINVSALMPGSTPPKMRELTKSHSLDLPKGESATPPYLSTSDAGFFTPAVSSATRDVSNTSFKRAVTFEDAIEKVEVLQSVTKDRAKIPIKRRPSTRRGRQQAIRNSTSDFTLAGGEDDAMPSAAGELSTAEIRSKQIEPVAQDECLKSNLTDLPPSSEEIKTSLFQTQSNAGIFDDIRNDDAGLFPKTSTAPDFFEDSGNSGSSLFPSAPPPGKTVDLEEKSKPKGSIFGSDDSDSEFFGRAGIKEVKTDSKGKKAQNAKKKSLFNDSSSDEDLFSATSSSASRRKENLHKTVEKRSQKPSATRKLENIEPDEDPLSSLLK